MKGPRPYLNCICKKYVSSLTKVQYYVILLSEANLAQFVMLLFDTLRIFFQETTTSSVQVILSMRKQNTNSVGLP